MSLKFAANLNFLFTEGGGNILQKLQLARSAGFRAIEISFPDVDLDKVVKAREDSEIEVALMNIQLGIGVCSFGSSSIPGEEKQFKSHLDKSVSVAKALKCKKIHIMSGKVANHPSEDHLKTYISNLKYAAQILENENLLGLIEPINKYSLPEYFLNSYDTAIHVLEQVKSPNLKLMMDIFHLQHIRGNVYNTFNELKSHIGHIQIAQVPHRHEPNISGELDYSFVFRTIQESGYNDWIGCEYKPKTTTKDGLAWITEYGFSL